MRILFLLFSLSFLASCAHRSKQLCDNIRLEEGKLNLGRNERLLVCGAEKDSVGWNEVPLPQAQYHLSVFLQAEGYLTPRFERDRDQLKVWSGPRSNIASFELTGEPAGLDAGKKRKVVGNGLTPAKLNEIEQWANTELNSTGYACPEIKLTAEAWNGKVFLDVQPGPRQKVALVERVELEGIDPDALARYQAFDVGDYYDIRETQLTASRMLSDGLLQSAYFTERCNGDQVDLRLNGSLGPPRALRFEIGASTEKFPMVDITFNNARIDDRASSYSLVLHGDPRLQSLKGFSQLYILPWTKQTFLGPRFGVLRRSETIYETNEAKLGVDFGRYWDMFKSRFMARFGPTVNYVKTVRGQGPSDVTYLSFDGTLTTSSHDYEISTRHQYEGWTGSISYHGQQEGLGSQVNAHRFDINYNKLWNVGHFAPPLFILATRYEFVGVESGDATVGSGNDVLPIEYRVFYGGAENLRGFSRKSIDNRGAGYLTAAYMGAELRLVEQLPYNVQPILLYDIARLGSSSFELEEPLYTSPGVGVRWPSPFGAVRASAAKGVILNGNATTAGTKEEWVFFFSFGTEF